jgi:hypothetical protein
VFRNQTTLILGAGASVSYGYPTGHKLIGDIIDQANDVGRKYIADRLGFYDPVSIDAFLWNYRDSDDAFLSDVKNLITAVIYLSGRKERFYRDGMDDETPSNWYKFLWSALTAEQTPQQLGDRDYPLNLNIITFNYDVSLEYYLHSRIVSEHSMLTVEQQQGLLEKIDGAVHHVYGSVQDGMLLRPGLNPNHFIMGDLSRADAWELAQSSDSAIRLIDERDQVSKSKLEKILRNSVSVIVLGFAFDETNCGANVLNLNSTISSIPDGARINSFKYTNYGDQQIIEDRLSRLLAQYKGARSPLQRGVHKSTKEVYRALSEDFELK